MSTTPRRHRTTAAPLATWTLQDAKARLSEVLRRAQTAGPQHLTVHGREAAVVLSVEEFRRLKGGQTGQALIDVLHASPYRNLDLAPKSIRSPVRDVVL
jgi:prevent-host-death family protein